MTKLSIALYVVLACAVSAMAASGKPPGHLLVTLHNHVFHVIQHLFRLIPSTLR